MTWTHDLANIELCGCWFYSTFLLIPKKTGRSMPFSARNFCRMASRCFSSQSTCVIAQARRMRMCILRASRDGCRRLVRSAFFGLQTSSLEICRFLNAARRFMWISLCNNWSCFRNQKMMYQKQKQHSRVLLFYVLKHILISCVLTFYTESIVLVRICYFFE